MPSNTRHGLLWTAAEVEYLEHNRHLSAVVIGESLGRSSTSVNACRARLGLAKERAHRPPMKLVRDIAEKWAQEAKCSVPQILSSTRVRHIAWARWQVMLELSGAGYSLSGIGRALSLDHCTVLNGLKRASIPCPKPPSYRPKPKLLPREKIGAKAPPIIHKDVLVSGIVPPSLARLMGSRA